MSSDLSAGLAPAEHPQGFDAERRAFRAEPHLSSGTSLIAELPVSDPTPLGEVSAVRPPSLSTDPFSWTVTASEDQSMNGRWHSGVSSELQSSEGGLVWEVDTGEPTGYWQLDTPENVEEDGSFLRVNAEVLMPTHSGSSEVGGIELVPIVTPPVKNSTRIAAATISNPNNGQSTHETFAIVHSTSSVQQIAVTPETLQELTGSDSGGPVNVEYLLTEFESVPQAAEPVTFNGQPITPEMQDTIEEAWVDHTGDPLPTDPTVRATDQSLELQDLDVAGAPVLEGMEDPAELVVTVLDNLAAGGAPYDATAASVIAVSNPGTHNVVLGYCNDLNGDEAKLSIGDRCLWAVDQNGVEFPRQTSAERRHDREAVISVGSDEPESSLPLEGATVPVLLGVAGLATWARVRSSRRRHIHEPAPSSQETHDPFEGVEATDEARNKAYQALMHHLYSDGQAPPTGVPTLTSGEIATSLRDLPHDEVLASLVTATDFDGSPSLQLAHTLVSRSVPPLEAK